MTEYRVTSYIHFYFALNDSEDRSGDNNEQCIGITSIVNIIGENGTIAVLESPRTFSTFEGTLF